MKKQMDRLKVQMSQSLNRTEKSVALSTELLKLEETIGCYKQVCQNVHKKLTEGLQGCGKGTDGGAVERRLKKSNDFTLGQCLTEQGRLLNKLSPSSCLGQVLIETGGLCTSTGMNLVQYEISVEQLVLTELDSVLKSDLPAIASGRKQLDRLILELDTAKARLKTAREEEQHGGGPHSGAGGGRAERLAEELDDMERRVEQARDTLATDMMTFVAKDADLAGLIAKYLQYKREYHSSMVDQVLLTEPRVESVLLTKRGFPIFGSGLRDHLESFSIASGIAFPIQLCVTRLMDLGLEEEGLFRLSAGQAKVKRLRAEIEAGQASLASLETGHSDHHLLTATIKSYLRELPEPLMGGELYQDWLEAGSLEGDDKFDAVWNLLQHEHLPRENYKNIQYLFKFLNLVTTYSEQNKMTASNLAIVITPNVLWELEAVHDPMDVAVGARLAAVVEMVIAQYQWLFQNDSVCDWGEGLPPSPLSCRPPSPGLDQGHQGLSQGHLELVNTTSSSQASPVPTTRERKNKGKSKAPAPLSPQGSPGSPIALRRDSPGTPRAVKSVQEKDTVSSHGHSRSRSVEGGSLRAASHPPSQPPPQPPAPAPNSPQIGWADLPAAPQEQNAPVPTSPPLSSLPPSPNGERPTPVPAPRLSKPALPNKPEGLARNASRAGDSNGWGGGRGGKESTDL